MSAAQKTSLSLPQDAEETEALKARLNTARSEIEAALSEAKAAAETIIGRAEDLLALEAAPAIGDIGIGILEACGFQDLTGQRLKKALAALDRVVAAIEEKSFGLGLIGEDPAYAAWQAANLVHGPASPHEALDQDAIDQVFQQAARETDLER